MDLQKGYNVTIALNLKVFQVCTVFLLVFIYYTGAVITLCEKFGVKIINGSPYHPHTQEKVSWELGLYAFY